MVTPPATCAIVPAVDEEAAIAAVVEGALTALDRVIVVDNGSRDATAVRAREAGAQVVSEPRRGYAAACLTGAGAAPAGCVLVFTDGDGSDDPGCLALVAAPVVAGDADLVLGSRIRGEREPGALRPHQVAGNRLFAAIIRLLRGPRLTDLGPMRAIGREHLLALDMRSQSSGWPVELVLKASRAGLRVSEVPVNARPRAGGASKVSGSLRASLHAGLCFAGAIVRHALRR